MKKPVQRLALNKETIRHLDSTKLRQVAGGARGAGCSYYETLNDGTCSTNNDGGEWICSYAP